MERQFKKICEDLGIKHIGVIVCKEISFLRELRATCETNQCGKYGQSWCCPPAIGEMEKIRAELKQYEKGLVIQTIQELEDCFDFEGMIKGKRFHKGKLVEILREAKERLPQLQLLPLSVGGCDECASCTYVEGKPCRMPKRAIPGMEGYGIDVFQMTKSAGLHYNNGPKTVSYVSFIGWH
ncbi:MAG: DUF2284 domain-containing protein [Niameybacter sp.]